MSKLSNLGHSLYEGKVSIDFIGRKWLWYSISGLIVLLALYGLLGKGLNLGIEFEGGVEYRVSMKSGEATQANVEKIRDAVAQTALDSDIPAAESPIVNTSGSDNIRIQTEPLEQRPGHRDRADDPGHGQLRPTSAGTRSARPGVPRSRNGRCSGWWSSWCWWCCSSGRTSVSGRCPSAPSSRWPTTC